MKRYYSPAQIAIASVVGTPMAAAFLIRSNIAERMGPLPAWLAWIAFCTLFIAFAAVNPITSQAANIVIFMLVSCFLLAADHLLSDQSNQVSRSWGEVLIVAIAFLVGWLTLLLVVFA